MKKGIVKKYSKDDVTVVWKPDLCIHSENCFHGLPEVFDPRQRPWINVNAANSNRIKDQIAKCPSGALSILSRIDNGDIPPVTIKLTKNGPLLITGKIVLQDSEGKVEDIKHEVTAFCRCGASQNKPYCDGSHQRVGFES